MSKADPNLWKHYINSDHYMPYMINTDIYHYTFQDALASILSSNKHYLTLWASRYDCLNDKTEGKIAKNIFDEVLLEMYNNKTFSEEEYNLISEAKLAKTLLHFDIDKSPVSIYNYYMDTYICSFSKNDDSLPMWNYYSKGNFYSGINVGFLSENLKNSFSNFSKKTVSHYGIFPVIYKKEEQKNLVKKFLKDIKNDISVENYESIIAIISKQLLDWSFVFKNASFAFEEEVRIIIDVDKNQKKLPINYRFSNGLCIPYIELKFDKSYLNFVNLGPLHKDEEAKETQKDIIENMLNKSGYHDISVEYSKVPLRY